MKAMRRSDRQMSEADALALLSQGEYGVLCLTEADGYPYGVPLSFAVKGNTIYMHCALEGKKLNCIQSSPKASLVVVGQTQVLPSKFSTAYESVMAFGSVTLVESETQKHEALMALVEKYSPGFEVPGDAYAKNSGHKTAVLAMTIEVITGKERGE